MSDVKVGQHFIPHINDQCARKGLGASLIARKGLRHLRERTDLAFRDVHMLRNSCPIYCDCSAITVLHSMYVLSGLPPARTVHVPSLAGGTVLGLFELAQPHCMSVEHER